MPTQQPRDNPRSSAVESPETPETVPAIELTPEDEARIMAGGTLPPDGILPDPGFMGCYC